MGDVRGLRKTSTTATSSSASVALGTTDTTSWPHEPDRPLLGLLGRHRPIHALDEPGSYRRLWPAAGATPQLGTEFDCSRVSSSFARCIIGLDEGIVRLLPLDGSTPIALGQRCARLFPAVRTIAVAWTASDTSSGCKPGRDEHRTIAGKLTVSTRRCSRLQQPVTAFGKLVVATSIQRHLVTISNLTSRLERIVGNGAG